ncbi:MAG: hypothetical protein LBH25_05340 [Fibromonadaceae bacterium]|nr:hypothetical protein [Fibromonadaceae bacterium]
MKYLFLTLFILTSFLYAGDCPARGTLYNECSSKISYECNPNSYGFNSRMNSENGFRECSDLVKKCDGCDLRYDKKNGSSNFYSLKMYLQERAKQDSIERETEKREKAKQESIKRVATEEIFALIKNNAEISLILGKCNEYSLKSTPLQECKDIQDSIKITKITALLKANKLEESLGECKQAKLNPNEKITDLCKNQLVAKIKKLPKNKINSIELAKIYYDCDSEDGNEDNCKAIAGYVFQNNGKMLLIEDIGLGHTVMIQHTGHIGRCQLEPNSMRIPFLGYAKYLGRKTYTSLLGNQSVPNYQLLFCESGD